MSYASRQTAGNSCLETTQITCPECNQLMCHSTQISVQCHGGQGYHRSCCINCLLMEVDHCCFEITEEILSTIDDYNECKLINRSKHVQEITDRAIANFLEYALRSAVYIDNAPTKPGLVADSCTQAPSLQHDHQAPAGYHKSADHDSYLEDVDVKIICDDLGEEDSYPCTDLTNATTPEDLPGYVDDQLPPPADISTIFDEALSNQELSETMDDAQRNCPEWLEWKH